MLAKTERPELKLVYQSSNLPTVLVDAETEAERTSLRAIETVFEALDEDIKLLAKESGTVSISDYTLILNDGAMAQRQLQDYYVPDYRARYRVTAWPMVSHAPLMARQGEGANLLIVSIDFSHQSRSETIGKTVDLIRRLSQNREQRVSVFSQLGRVNEDGQGVAHSLRRKLADWLPEFEIETVPIELGVARLSSSPKEFSIILVDHDFGLLTANVATQSIDQIGQRAVLHAMPEQFIVTTESVPRIRAKGENSTDDVLPSLQAAMLLLQALGRHGAAVRLHNGIAATLEDRIFPMNGRVDFFAQSRLGPAAFVKAVIDRADRTPKRLPKPLNEGGGASARPRSLAKDARMHLSIVS